jgi:isoleucyl-tRNA synthetase
MPFITEEIYQNIAVSVNKNAKLSIHLTDWPKFDEEKIDTKVNDTMGLVRRIVTHGLSIRAGKNIKVRQPLSDIYVYYSGSLELSQDLIMAIKDELNVKNLVLKKDISEDTFVKKEFKIDFSLLGPKYGKKVKEIADAINNGNYESKSGFYSVLGEKLLEEEIKTTFKPKNDKFEVAGDEKVTVAFNIEITEDLRKEGLARDIIRIIQDMRKKANFNVEERIELFFDTENNEISSILLNEWSRYISKEILANKITPSIENNSEYNEEVSLSGSQICFGIKKIG